MITLNARLCSVRYVIFSLFLFPNYDYHIQQFSSNFRVIFFFLEINGLELGCYQRSLGWLMGVLRGAGIFLEMGNLTNGKETGCFINCPQSLLSPHILENFEGRREITLLCFDGFKEGDSLPTPLSGIFAITMTKEFFPKVCLSCFVVSPFNASSIH